MLARKGSHLPELFHHLLTQLHILHYILNSHTTPCTACAHEFCGTTHPTKSNASSYLGPEGPNILNNFLSSHLHWCHLYLLMDPFISYSIHPCIISILASSFLPNPFSHKLCLKRPTCCAIKCRHSGNILVEGESLGCHKISKGDGSMVYGWAKLSMLLNP